MTQQLRVFATLKEDVSLIPNTRVSRLTPLTPGLGRMDSFGLWGVFVVMCTGTYVTNNNKIFLKKE